jgi:iron complex transport system substrate-binding protein
VIRRLLPAAALVGLLVSGCSAGPTSETAAATRTVTHAHGVTEVPAAPARVVVLEPVQLDTTVALGAVPVGAAVPPT